MTHEERAKRFVDHVSNMEPPSDEKEARRIAAELLTKEFGEIRDEVTKLLSDETMVRVGNYAFNSYDVQFVEFFSDGSATASFNQKEGIRISVPKEDVPRLCQLLKIEG